MMLPTTSMCVQSATQNVRVRTLQVLQQAHKRRYMANDMHDHEVLIICWCYR
jgi:hypothetical protein